MSRVLLFVSSVLVLASLVLPELVAGQACLDENGSPVDWWVAVKMYRDKKNGYDVVAKGHAYIYGDVNSKAQGAGGFWTNSSSDVTDPNSAMGRTIGQIYAGASDATNGYIMYNDELPGGKTSMTYGHSKGHMMWSSSAKQGFWLLHSVPKYADSPANGASAYVYPTTGMEYGQSFLCVSLDIANIDKAIGQFMYTNPQVYGSQWVASLASKMKNANAFLNQGAVRTDAASNYAAISTIGGMSFTHFAKTVAWGQSIYSELIGPYYGTTLIVESWQRPVEDPLLPPTYKSAVYSALTLSAPAGADWGGVTWKETEDHAKWAVGTGVVCIGDINKQKSQWQRSGGMMCSQDNVLTQVFTGLITSTDQSNFAAVAPKIALE